MAAALRADLLYLLDATKDYREQQWVKEADLIPESLRSWGLLFPKRCGSCGNWIPLNTLDARLSRQSCTSVSKRHRSALFFFFYSHNYSTRRLLLTVRAQKISPFISSCESKTVDGEICTSLSEWAYFWLLKGPRPGRWGSTSPSDHIQKAVGHILPFQLAHAHGEIMGGWSSLTLQKVLHLKRWMLVEFSSFCWVGSAFVLCPETFLPFTMLF